MENIHDWNREDKLFAVRGLSESQDQQRNSYLLQLVVDDDPVVRGKAALALEDSPDEVLLRGVDVLLDEGEAEKTILACELLGFTQETDFTDRVEPLIEAEDDRVVRSAIELLHKLPEQSTKHLLERLVDRYRDAWWKSLLRLLERLRTPGILTVLQQLAPKVDNEQRIHLLRVASRLEEPDTGDWIDRELEQLDCSDRKRDVIEWLNER